MIIYPARHWFEALRPTLEINEEELFYRHPTLPFKINQIGVVDFDDEDAVFEGLKGQAYRIRMKKNGSKHWSYVSIGTRARACYECYHNVVCTGRHFMFKDGNPLNCTVANLVPVLAPYKSKDPEGYALYSTAAKATKGFMNASVDWMMKKEEWVIKKEGEPSHYWKLWGELPTWLQVARLKRSGLPKEFFSGPAKGRPVTISQQQKDQSLVLHLQGISARNIAVELGISPTSAQRFIRQLRD